MLYTTRKSAEAALNASLLSVTAAADIISSTLLTIDKGVHWCNDQINKSLSDEAKSSWLEHEAQLRGFSSADQLKKYNEQVAAKAVAEENKEIAAQQKAAKEAAKN